MKIKEAKQILKDKKLDAIVLFSQNPNFLYFAPFDMEHAMVIITKKESIIFANPLHSPKRKGFKIFTYKNYRKDFENIMKRNKVKRIGYDEEFALVRQKRFLKKFGKVVDASQFISNLRLTKTPEEMVLIRKACEITDETFSLLVKNFSKFKTEKDVELFVRLEFMKRGAEVAYDPIVASGKNAVIPHHVNTDELRKGFLVLDIGSKYEGYCSDMTRTVYLGTPTQSDLELYDKLLSIQEELVRQTVVGAKCSELHNNCVKLLGSDAKYLMHSLGHGFGLQIHEAPALYPKAKDSLKLNTVVTIEPGYYNPKTGRGIRIEDDIYLGKKIEILNKSTKKLIVIKGNFK